MKQRLFSTTLLQYSTQDKAELDASEKPCNWYKISFFFTSTDGLSKKQLRGMKSRQTTSLNHTLHFFNNLSDKTSPHSNPMAVTRWRINFPSNKQGAKKPNRSN